MGKRCLRESIARSSSPEGVVILECEIGVSFLVMMGWGGGTGGNWGHTLGRYNVQFYYF